MKKTITILLSIALLLSLSISAVATEAYASDIAAHEYDEYEEPIRVTFLGKCIYFGRPDHRVIDIELHAGEYIDWDIVKMAYYLYGDMRPLPDPFSFWYVGDFEFYHSSYVLLGERPVIGHAFFANLDILDVCYPEQSSHFTMIPGEQHAQVTFTAWDTYGRTIPFMPILFMKGGEINFWSEYICFWDALEAAYDRMIAGGWILPIPDPVTSWIIGGSYGSYILQGARPNLDFSFFFDLSGGSTARTLYFTMTPNGIYDGNTPSDINLALNTQGAVMSASSAQGVRTADRANNGVREGAVTNSWSAAGVNQEWLMVDFGEQRNFNTVWIFQGGSRIMDYRFEHSNDGVNWTVFHSSPNRMLPATPAVYEVTTSATTQARFIRLVSERSSGAAIAVFEFEVYYMP